MVNKVAKRVRLKSCPKCRGDQYLDYDQRGFKEFEVWTCVQCGTEVDGDSRVVHQLYTKSEIEQLMI